MAKARFNVDLAPNTISSLEAHGPLALTLRDSTSHLQMECRAPLGVYNISVARICDKVARLCERLELHFASTHVAQLDAQREIEIEIVDYVELAIYAAAEHVGDVDLLARAFFRSVDDQKRSLELRALRERVKLLKRSVALFANAIKHRQSRVRLFSMEFSHDGRPMLLHGYFIEAVRNGEVGADVTYHGTKGVLSITSLVWEVLYFVLDVSRAVACFVECLAPLALGPHREQCAPLSRAIAAAARLPLYTFGEDHPFKRTTLCLVASDGDRDLLRSSLYGSLWQPWTQSTVGISGRMTARFEGDGSTRTFHLPRPQRVDLQHWT